ncbi:MAG TPA: tetratricopeptide repeat protein [Syntrophales bacterium]|nr:tetratricopeptide repeat protein [Syntrophales bacterium]
MKRTIIASLALGGLIAAALIGCGQQSSPPPPPPPPPAAQAPAPAAPAPAAPAGPSLEVTQHLKQGMAYVSTAKNANSPAIFNENINNAINEFSNAIKKDPGYATAYSNRAVAYMMQKKYNLALDDLKKAKELKPSDPAVRYNTAACHSLMGNVDLAFVELDAALANGFNDYDSLRKDPDLANMRKHPDWRKTLEKYKVFIN